MPRLGIGNYIGFPGSMNQGSGSPAPPTYDPSYYSDDLVAWWHASATYLTVDGSNLVGAWEDKSGNNNNLAQSNANRKPTWDSTAQAVEFDNDLGNTFDDRMYTDLTSSTTDSGASHLELNATHSATGSNDDGFSFGVIMKSSDWETENMAWMGHDSENHSAWRYATNPRIGFGLVESDITGGTTKYTSFVSHATFDPLGADYVFIVGTVEHSTNSSSGDTESTTWINGTKVTDLGTGYSADQKYMFINQIGQRGGTHALEGFVKDIFVYRRKLSQTEIENMYTWAQTRMY